MEKIISIHTNPNDIVLDPFMGSGTTGLACKRLERNFRKKSFPSTQTLTTSC
ncbi:DNA methyltransferase [Helicobacter pylori]|uniref:DNA methyltransferase n=1 Tax=Helicobacter pylori TaxID=210 RepID=UPI00398F30C4